MRLAQAVWLIGQLLMESDEGFEVGPALKQIAEEIQRYAKPAARDGYHRHGEGVAVVNL
jgi:hypothetical protein